MTLSPPSWGAAVGAAHGGGAARPVACRLLGRTRGSGRRPCTGIGGQSGWRCLSNGGGVELRARRTIRALIFDLDGTLWDAAAFVDGWNLGLAELGLAAPGLRRTASARCAATPSTVARRSYSQNYIRPQKRWLKLSIVRNTVVRGTGGVLYPGVAEGLPRLAESYRLFLVSTPP